MKKRGFTLIELLAVIVVLAVVALIAFPIIAGIIEKTKRSAAYRSVEGYVEAANNAAVLYDLDNNKGINVTEAKHTFTSNVDTEDFSKIKAKGTLPTYSYLDFDINKKVVTEGHFCINGYSVLYSDGTAKASETKYCEEDNTGNNGSGDNGGNNNTGGNNQDSLSNMRYNEETDFVQIKRNGTWVNWQRAFLQNLVYFNSTVGYNAGDFGSIVQGGNNNSTRSYVINPTNITYTVGHVGITGEANGGKSALYTAYGQFLSNEYVDLTHFDKLVFSGTLSYSGYNNTSYYFRIILQNEAGTITEIYNSQATSYSNTEVSLTQYSGRYKLGVRIYTGSWNAIGGSTSVVLSDMYLS